MAASQELRSDPKLREGRVTNVDHKPCIRLGEAVPLALDCGQNLGPFDVAYQTYGTLNAEKSNAILICHALTGDQYVAGTNPVTGRTGWWDELVGPGLVFDTDRFFVICSNVLGGCMGTTGPADLDPKTGKQYGLDFPVITIGDMVRAQVMLIDALGIDKLFAVVGGSMGAMQAIEWAASHPDRVFAVVPVAGAARHTAQNIAFHEVGRQAIMADPDWHGGHYAAHGTRPIRGLSVARMVAHITYLSEASFHSKFGRMLQDTEELTYGFDAEFRVESYLRYQGSAFVDRFDANAYLYITRAMDYFDLVGDDGAGLVERFRGNPVRFCLISFTSDWLFPTVESRRIVTALAQTAAHVSFVEIDSDKGHDSFLLDVPDFHEVLAGFIDGAADHQGLGSRKSAD